MSVIFTSFPLIAKASEHSENLHSAQVGSSPAELFLQQFLHSQVLDAAIIESSCSSLPMRQAYIHQPFVLDGLLGESRSLQSSVLGTPEAHS